MLAIDTSSGLLIPIVGVLGALIGSFLNVVGLRLMREESIVSPGSHCYSCKTPIKPYDNIPIISWLLLKGKCRACQAAIHWQYPVVEALTMLLFIAIFMQFGVTWTTLVFWILSANLVVTLITDFTEQSIFDINSLGMIPLGLGWSWWHGMSGPWIKLLGAVPMPQSFFDALLAVVLAWVVFFLLNLLSRLLVGQNGFGEGDARLLMGFGSFWGLTGIGFILVGGVVLQVLVTVPFLIAQWIKAKVFDVLGMSIAAFVLAGVPLCLQYMTTLPAMATIAVAAVCDPAAIILVWIALKRAKAHQLGLTTMPFGPALVVAAWVYMFTFGT